MSTFLIEGGHRLKGEITPQGAKNEALQVICATLLTSQCVRIQNIPNILDVNNLIALLEEMGVKRNGTARGIAASALKTSTSTICKATNF